MQTRRFLGLAVVPVLALLATAVAASAQQQTPTPPSTQAAAPEAPHPAPGSIKNPYTGNPEKIAAGKALWFKMSCYGCHGTMGGGGMGPNLTDAEWRYGGDDTSVFTTIKFGRPGGMPPWGAKMSDDEILTVMAYVRSLYKGDPAAKVW